VLSQASELPCGPDRVEIAPLHLSITRCRRQRHVQNVHLLDNGDLGPILAGATRAARAQRRRARFEDDGVVLVSLDVAGDHDEIHNNANNQLDTLESLTRAIECLIVARDPVRRVTRP
jgi:hypothetical protein